MAAVRKRAKIFGAMSGLVDMWTSELAKLREKGQTIWPSSGSSPTNLESSKEGESRTGSLGKSLPTFIRGMRVSAIVLPYSEASISMLVECFSP